MNPLAVLGIAVTAWWILFGIGVLVGRAIARLGSGEDE